MTNSIRPFRLASLRCDGEAQTRASGKPKTLRVGAKAVVGAEWWLETESPEGEARDVERPARQQGARARPGGSQSTHSSAEAG